MDHANPPLFVVLSYGSHTSPYCVSVVKLETPVVKNESAPTEPKMLQVNLQDNEHIVARFTEPPVVPPLPNFRWLFSPPTVSTEDMYLVPDWDADFKRYHFLKPPLQGYKFNFKTGECRPIKPPRVPKSQGHVVNRREGHIYFMAHPDCYYDTPDPVFECYNPEENRWKALQPFPDHAVRLKRCHINATAVLNDTILYNMGGCRIWAYYVPQDKWYIVHVEDDRCYDIVGEAVVLENTVYALTNVDLPQDLVLALSIERKEIADGGLVFICSLRSAIHVRGMDQIKYKKTDGFTNTRRLVHLGEDNFCLVQSCKHIPYFSKSRYQPIQLTCLKHNNMGEYSMTVTNICVYEVEIQPDNQFEVRLCFSLPECKTTALKQGKRFIYNLDPCREGHAAYASKQEDKTDFNPVPEVVKPVQASTQGHCAASESERSNNSAEEGHSICVRKLPPDATVIELERKLKIFGSIKRDGIRVIIDNKPGNCCFSAYVDFESATSKRDAIEASSIVIQGCHAEIEEKPCCCQGDAAYSSKQKDKTDSNPKLEDGKPVQASTHGHGAFSESSNTAEGHCILVTNLPPGATLNQVARKVKKFGFFKRGRIRGHWDGNRLSAVCVKFESATAKLNAIAGPGFRIHGYQAKIRDCGVDIFLVLGPIHVSTHSHSALFESRTTAEGHCILVTNLPHDATLTQVAKKVKKFWFLKRDGIRGIWDGNRLFGVCVKFESATAKLNAIEGPCIKILGDQAKISDCGDDIFSMWGKVK